jgi:uncharacterized protein (TIGR00290 family)
MARGGFFILWSGGKDSYLSYRYATRKGLRVRYALSYVDRRSGRLIGCYLREKSVRRQAQMLGMEFLPVYGSKRKGNLVEELLRTLRVLKPEGGVFGDINQKENRLLLERICSELGIEALFPLWGLKEKLLLEESLKISKPVIVCRRVKKVPPKFLGRVLDREFVEFLLKKGLSPSGERGEYQTFVAESEEFKLKIELGRRFRRSYYECIDIEVL